MKEDAEVRAYPPAGKKHANHICVLVHGLHGNPSHLDYIAGALREKHADKLYILAVKRNTGSLTYDGIELGGERVAHEIEEALETLYDQDYDIQKLSIVGYSLGGLVARYAIGLLYAKGYFDKIQPVNFTTFATPHVGVRSPARKNHFWNVLGARTISASGRQLFMIDSFRDTGKPLLSVLATPGSIFMMGLAKFKHRSLYANIVNDKAAVFYTTGISKTDPFMELDKYQINYLQDYSPVIVNPHRYITVKSQKESAPFRRWMIARSMSFLTGLPLYVFLCIFVPIASILYLINAAIQTIRSKRRIRSHEEGKSGVFFGSYKVPLVVEEMRNVVEDMYETVNATQKPEYLFRDDDDTAESISSPKSQSQSSIPGIEQSLSISSRKPLNQAGNGGIVDRSASSSSLSPPPESKIGVPETPTLALTPLQFAIIDSLNSVGFRKYPVHIHKVFHSHAAIIVRMPKKKFEEGKIVVRHWLDTEFRV
ncbi:lipase/serine esterase [Blastomyces dermatitidis ER-3]|uniref:Lipase/serine esterase n=1 Tax=Ajellomyces dermatitidis (strain ER-3 / ATCC MYA-2586) TaxID=559297 RepID=A0ABP2F784_AJEDR|nr:lipase/serine esterase [Blastomyces dermatitidis ER-3]EEQ91767.1 lipase/serine esterase [Blastomyces dermatitidis ER-3]